MTVPKSELLDFTAAADVLRITPRALAAIRAAGNGPKPTIINGAECFSRESIRAYLDSQPRPRHHVSGRIIRPGRD